DRDHARPEVEDALNDLRRLAAGIDPGCVVTAHLDDGGESAEFLETQTISLGVAEDSWPDVRVEDDRALDGFAFNKQSICRSGRVDRQRERSDVKRHSLIGNSRQRRWWE